MYQVRIVVHAITGAPPLPADQVRAAFENKVSLTFTNAPALDADPKTFAAYQELLQRWALDPRVGDPAHLVLGGVPGDGFGDVNGMLLSPRRGGAVVFAQAPALEGDDDALLQTCVHELAHLFNRTHEDGTTFAPTIECPAFVRAQQPDIALAWSRLYRDVPQGLACYPFSDSSLRSFVNDSPHAVLPWGNPFTGSTTGEGETP